MSPAFTSSRCALCTCRTAVCSTRRNADRLLGLALARRAASCSIDSSRYVVEIAAQLRQVGAAGGEDPLAVGIVRERVEQVLERQVGVPARDRLAVARWSARFQASGLNITVYRSRSVSSIVAAAGTRCRARESTQRVDFGFRDFPRIDAAQPLALHVHLHHDAVRLGRRLLETLSSTSTTNSIVV